MSRRKSKSTTEPKPRTDHDGIYHQLYSHPPMMADLLREFVTEPWVKDLDLSRMEPIKTKFHVPGMRKRESDVVWRIPTQAGDDVYLLVLLEFQSEVDRWMVLRVIVYMCLLWLQLLHEKKIPASGLLPPLFPIVLHNGDKPWLQPVRLHELIALPKDSPLWAFQPDGGFFLVDQNRFSPEELEELKSLSALVFRVEQCRRPEDLPALAEEVIAWFDKHSGFEALKQVLAIMLMNVMAFLGEDQQLPVNHPINLLEVPNMLQTRMEAWRNEKYREWRQEGERDGEKKGEAAALLKLIRRKFGQVPDGINEKVTAAKPEFIEIWLENILFANSLDDVFAS